MNLTAFLLYSISKHISPFLYCVPPLTNQLYNDIILFSIDPVIPIKKEPESLRFLLVARKGFEPLTPWV